jgi:hypothetical protein
MSEHKANPNALMSATLPNLLPAGCASQVLLEARVVPMKHVLIVAAENIQRSIVDEKVTAIRIPGGEWQPVPMVVVNGQQMPAIVHQLGTPLAPELCDMAVMIGTGVVDTLSMSLVVPGGPPPQPKNSGIIHGELLRVPLVMWREQHMRKLRGPEN